MKYWIHTIIIILLGLIFQPFLPWWIIILIAAISAFIINQKPLLMLLFGFLGGVILWGGVAFYIDLENGQILSSKLANLFGGISPNLLIIITAILGGLIAGFASYAGINFRKVVSKTNS